jgi:hypothetical protein
LPPYHQPIALLFPGDTTVEEPAVNHPLSRVFERALRRPFPKLPGDLSDDCKKVAALCYRLRDEENEFYLSERSVRELLDIGEWDARALLQLLCDRGIIRRIGTGNNDEGKSRRMASTYYWCGWDGTTPESKHRSGPKSIPTFEEQRERRRRRLEKTRRT